MTNCKKCGKEGYRPDVEPVRMCGGYRTELCVPCRNAFEEYLRPQLKHMAGLEACLAAAVYGGDLETATDYAERATEERTRLYAISKAWATE